MSRLLAQTRHSDHFASRSKMRDFSDPTFTEPTKKPFPIDSLSGLVRSLGHKPSREALMRIGRVALEEYKEIHGTVPPKRKVEREGKEPFFVNDYSSEDYNGFIREIAEDYFRQFPTGVAV